MNVKLTVILLFIGINLYAQDKLTIPDRELIDQEKLMRCKKELKTIQSMTLKCDTVFDYGNWFTGIYYDVQGKLRKSVYRWAFNDGTHEYVDMSAYYNANGDLLYMEQKSGSNCTDEEEYFYIDNGHIVDCSYYYDCGCCEEDDKEWLEEIRPVVGSLFAGRQEHSWKDYFVSAHNALNFYYEHCGYVAKVMPGTIPIISPKRNPHFRYRDDLKSPPFFVVTDSIDSPKTYFIMYGKYPYNSEGIIVKEKDRYASFKTFPDGVLYDNYTISRQDIDGIGNDELIIRWTNKDKENGILVWDLDAYSCLLNIQETIHRDNPEGGGYKVDLSKKQLAVSIIKNHEKNILGPKYIYRLTDTGFVLDRVEWEE